MCTREDDNVVCMNGRPVHVGNLFTQVGAASIRRVAQPVVVVRFDERVVAPCPRQRDEILVRERLRIRVGQVVTHAARISTGDALVLFRPRLRERHTVPRRRCGGLGWY